MFTFAYSTNSNFSNDFGKPCQFGTDGKHVILRFEDGHTITTTRVTNCYLLDAFSDDNPSGYLVPICVETRSGSTYDIYCNDDERAFKVVKRLNQIAEDNRLHANMVSDVKSGASLGEALANAIIHQVKGQRQVVC